MMSDINGSIHNFTKKAVFRNEVSHYDGTTKVFEVAKTYFQFGKKLKLKAASGADSASGLLAGVGTSADPATSSTANDKFLEFRCKSSATSGDNRLIYMRYELGGAAAAASAFAH